MKRLTIVLLSLSIVSCAHVSAVPRIVQTRVMTYNIRLDLASDEGNAWPNRRHLVLSLISREAPDILGLQEVLLSQKKDLERALGDYTLVGSARDDGREAGEFSPVAFLHHRYDVLDSGTFWLSPTPSVPGKGWDAANPRVATWVALRDRQSGHRLRILNTHFDHVGQVARRQSAKMVVDWVRDGARAGLPTVVLGDFNATPQSDPYQVLTSGLADARLLSRTPPYGPPGTFNGFRIDSEDDAPIDHIFVSRGWQVNAYAVLTQHWGGRLPSDHYPVLVTLTPTP